MQRWRSREPASKVSRQLFRAHIQDCQSLCLPRALDTPEQFSRPGPMCALLPSVAARASVCVPTVSMHVQELTPQETESTRVQQGSNFSGN